jgi:hypothetical protein
MEDSQETAVLHAGRLHVTTPHQSAPWRSKLFPLKPEFNINIIHYRVCPHRGQLEMSDGTASFLDYHLHYNP